MITKGQITITTLSNGTTINSWIECNATQQIYNRDSNTYVPDWSKHSLMLTPRVHIASSNLDQLGLKNAIIKKWTINNTVVNPDDGGNPMNAYYISEERDQDDYGVLYIQNNIIGDPIVNVTVEGACKDNDGKWVDFSSSISLSRISNGTDAVRVLLFTGNTGNVVENGEGSIDLIAHAYRGSVEDCSKMNFKWYKASATGWEEITSDTEHVTLDKEVNADIPVENQADTNNKLTIDAEFIDNVEVIKVTVEDVDDKSSTKGQTSSAIMDIKDVTDLYSIEFDTTRGGTTLTSSNPTTTIQASISKKGNPVNPESVTWLWDGYYPTNNGSDREQLTEWKTKMGERLATDNVTLSISDLQAYNTPSAILTCQATF